MQIEKTEKKNNTKTFCQLNGSCASEQDVYNNTTAALQ